MDKITRIRDGNFISNDVWVLSSPFNCQMVLKQCKLIHTPKCSDSQELERYSDKLIVLRNREPYNGKTR